MKIALLKNIKVASTILLTIVCFLSTCNIEEKNNDKPNEGVQIIGVKTYENKPVKLSEIFNDIDYIPLEKKDDFKIATITKLIAYKENYYILDRSVNDALFCFNNLGQMSFHISAADNPDSIAFFYDFTIDTNTGNIVILDKMARKLLLYDLTGVYKKQIDIGISCSLIENYNNENYIFRYHGNTEVGDTTYHSNLLLLNKNNLSVTADYFPYIEVKDEFVGRKCFSASSDKVFFTYAFNDTIYKIENTKPVAAYFVDFGSAHIPDYFFSGDTETLSAYMMQGNYYSLIDYLTVTDKIISFSYFGAGKIESLLYSRNNETVVNNNQIINDFDGIPFRGPVAADKEVLISFLYPSEILAALASKDSQVKITEEISTLANVLTNKSNPVLMLFEPNENF